MTEVTVALAQIAFFLSLVSAFALTGVLIWGFVRIIQHFF